MEQYLHARKSVMISSPAGSGKTEKLARRYVALLASGSRIEHILAITFTDKAAAEMKERILSIIEAEFPELFSQVRDKIPFMRISTIHSFCLKLLKRFAMELGIDPTIEVLDEFAASTLWTEAVYECLMEERDRPDLFFSMITNRGVKGWDSVLRIVHELHEMRPFPELLVREQHPVGEEEKNILSLYARCLDRYTEKKRAKRWVDFDDIEILAYEALVNNPEWHNILYSFDEHTDHILVDEFQDTSSLQWKIIDKLTEEWRSGIGSKRERGKVPTLFLVGDEKQSIYLFRGANVGLFHEVKQKLAAWLGEEFHFEAIKENYRSLTGIVDFVNELFGRLMPTGISEPWRVTYSPFEATRDGSGRVELILLDGDEGEGMRKKREREASVLARRIASLNNDYEIWEHAEKRKCRYGDMAILLRRRTYLPVYEDALRRHGIPFLVVKGIGFYDEPEVAMLRELLFFLVDPRDDYSLFCVLRSPLFAIDYPTVFATAGQRKGDPLFRRIATSKNRNVLGAHRLLSTWLEKSEWFPLAVVLEDALTETGAWRYVRDRQRHANVRKFISLVEGYESRGLSRLAIREKLIHSRTREESKAHVSAEGMNAVQIMTVHAAKGLQFPMVFLPALDEDSTPRSGPLVIHENGDLIALAYEDDARRRRESHHFRARKEKELEEEKRLFYVAVTRAQDFLCMTGVRGSGKPRTSRLTSILENREHLNSLTILTEADVDALCRKTAHVGAGESPPQRTAPSLHFPGPISYTPPLRWQDVTEDLNIRATHGDDWVLIGRVFHTLFEELSKGITSPANLPSRIKILFGRELADEKKIARLLRTVLDDFTKLETSGYLADIILPSRDAFAEIPFVLRKETTVYRGRIDRILFRDAIAHIYDYKTYPIDRRELPHLIDRYRFQMDIYLEAAEKIFSLPAKAYLLFTHLPLLVEM